MRSPSVVIGLLVALGLLSACGGPKAEDAKDTATAWFEAVRANEAERACALQLPSAARGIRLRYLPDVAPDSCPKVMQAYRDHLSEDLLATISRDGLEAEGVPKDDEIGVFPVTRRFQFAVILMRHSGDAWKVASVGLAPDQP